jgi:uncharacterized protein with PhoU and TrkA domain
MSALAKLAILLIIFAAGGATGVKWQLGVQARADVVTAEARASDVKQQRSFDDKASTIHVTNLAAINQKLGDARAYIAKLSNRECLSNGTVGVLNGAGDQPVPTTTGESESSTPTVTPSGSLRFATERDVAGAIAICRARYAEVSSQINQILDIEESRSPP